MLDRAVEHVGDRLDPAVRMPGEPRAIGRRIVVAEIVEQKERIALARLAEAEGAVQLHPGALHGRLGSGSATSRDGRTWRDLHKELRQHIVRRPGGNEADRGTTAFPGERQ